MKICKTLISRNLRLPSRRRECLHPFSMPDCKRMLEKVIVADSGVNMSLERFHVGNLLLRSLKAAIRSGREPPSGILDQQTVSALERQVHTLSTSDSA